MQIKAMRLSISANIKTKQLVKKAQLASFIGVLSLACASLLSTAPSAVALTFGEPVAGNPFFYGGSSSTSNNWTFIKTGDSMPIITPTCTSLEDGPCVQRTAEFPSNATIYGIAEAAAVYTWTFTGASSPYLIKFKGQFIQGTEDLSDEATARYLIGTNPQTPSFGSSISDQIVVELPINQTLSFQITNSVSGFGDLYITDFSATPVPSPLPVAGLGLAALGIYRAGRRKSRATPK